MLKDLKTTVEVANGAMEAHEFGRAARLYRKAYEKCVEGKRLAPVALRRSKLRWGLGLAGVVGGPVGLWVSNYGAKKIVEFLGARDFGDLDAIQRHIAGQEIELILMCPSVAGDEADDALLRRFTFIYTGVDDASMSRSQMVGTILGEVPSAEREAYELNQVLLGAAQVRGWTDISASLRDRGYTTPAGWDQQPWGEFRDQTHGSGHHGASSDGGQTNGGVMTLPDAYQLLGIDSGSSTSDVIRAYRKKVSEWHPDRLGDAPPELRDFATAQTARLTQAMNLIRDQRGSS